MVATQERLAGARRHWQDGRFEQAELLCRELVQGDPSCAEAWELLGDLCQSLGKQAGAVECYQHTVRLNPRNAEASNNLGIALMEEGQFDEAIATYREVLGQRPDYPEAHNNLGIALMEQGQLEEAIASYQQALRLQPKYPEARNNLGIAFLEQDRLGEAAEQFREALRSRPDYAEAHNNLGNTLRRLKRFTEAKAAYQKALQLDPEYVRAQANLGALLQEMGRHHEAVAAFQEAVRLESDSADLHNDLGIAFLEAGRADEAIASFRQALDLEPDYPEAHNNLAIVLMDQGHRAEAIALCRQAILLRPEYPEACNNLGNALAGQNKLAEAADAYQQALGIWPEYPEAHYNLGLVRANQGNLDEALTRYREAVRLKPDYVGAWNNLGNLHKDQALLDESIACYRKAIAHQPDDSALHSNLLFALHYHSAYDPEAVFAEHLKWARQLAEPLAKSIQTHGNDPTPGRRIRLGYVSPDFRAHVMGSYSEAIIAEHDRKKFEIFCYAEVSNPDAVTERIRQSANHWRFIHDRSDEEVAAMIRKDKIDVLVDFAGHTGGNRLLVFARKPAPVQASHFGYPDTTGLATMDYRLTDAICDPPGMSEAYHTEELVRLPDIWWVYPQPAAPEIPPTPARQRGSVTFGSFNNTTKITLDMLDLWARILAAVPGSRLHVLTGAGTQASARVRDRLTSRGIDGERITCLGRSGREEYFQRIGAVDVCLETYPYSGCNTTADSLWMGVPAVTLVGKTATTRQAATVLAHLGLPDLIAQTPDDYVAAAIRLAGSLPRLDRLRQALRERMKQSTLTNVARFTRQLEEAYRSMWQKWCASVSARPEAKYVWLQT